MNKLFLIGLFVFFYAMLFIASIAVIYVGVSWRNLIVLILGLLFAMELGWDFRNDVPKHIVKLWKEYKSEKRIKN